MKKRNLFYLASCLLALSILLTYSNHFNNDFHFDDSHTINSNPYIRNIGNAWLFFTDARTFSSLPANQMYRPLFTLSTAIDYRLGGGLKPFAFHVTNFIIFALQLAFMFFLFRRIISQAYRHEWNDWLALFAVGWYGLHTANAETVNYISARSDLLSTMLAVLALLLYAVSPVSKKWHLYLIPFALGTLVKPSALILAPLLFFYCLLFEKKKLGAAIYASLPALGLGLAFFILQRQMTPPSFYPSSIPLFNYLITQPFVALYYFKTFFLPFGLSADYDWGPIANIFNPYFAAGITFIFILLYLAYYFSKADRNKPISFGILWFFLALLPSSSFFPLSEVLNDHRIFFPFVGLALASVWGIGLVLVRFEAQIKSSPALKHAVLAACLFILLANAAGAFYRNTIWRTEEALWRDVASKSPKNGRGLMNYGLTQMAKGQYDTAINYFQAAKRYTPSYPILFINLAIAENASGQRQAAEEHFKKALLLSPNTHTPNYYYGRFLNELGRTDEAIALLEKANRLSPGFVFSKYLLIEIYRGKKMPERANRLAEEILKIDPSDAAALKLASHSKSEEMRGRPRPTAENYLDLSLAYYREKRYADCITAAEQALRLRPDLAAAYNNIGAAYNEMGKWEEAIIALNKALELQPDFPLARNNLNWAKSKLK